MTRPQGDNQLRKAFFEVQSEDWQGERRIPVHFNPVSLQHAISNTLKEEGRGDDKKQFVGKSTAKLSMQLVFDTTDSGTDVRDDTGPIGRLMKPLEGEETMPPVVSFEWGVYKFQGMFETYKETIDFFSENGVPLRSTVAVTLAAQDRVFETQQGSTEDTQASVLPETVELPRGSRGSASQLARDSGDEDSARDIARQNDDESLRFPGAGNAVVSESPSLQGPAAFASGASGGIGAGAGAGAGFGADFGASAGFGASASSTASASLATGASSSAALFGGSASAGISASAGAFAGLRAPASKRRYRAPRMRVARLVQGSSTAGLSAGPGAAFRVGGRMTGARTSSFADDVGANSSLNQLIRFEEDEP